MIYRYLFLIIFVIYLIRYIHQFIVINKTELKLIFNRATSFRTNPFIRQTLLLSTLKLILRLISKTIFKVQVAYLHIIYTNKNPRHQRKNIHNLHLGIIKVQETNMIKVFNCTFTHTHLRFSVATGIFIGLLIGRWWTSSLSMEWYLYVIIAMALLIPVWVAIFKQYKSGKSLEQRSLTYRPSKGLLSFRVWD